MINRWEWTKKRFGTKTRLLHRWHAYMFLFLAISGILLSIGTIRGDLGAGRVWLKQAHIWIGIGTVAILILYAPLLSKHWKILRKLPNQRKNLAFILSLVFIWILSGLVMAFYRLLPPGLTNISTFLHGLVSWIGIPYAIYHSITRLKWAKKANFEPAVQRQSELNSVTPPPITGQPFVNRRKFIRISTAAGIVTVMILLFGRNIGNFFGIRSGERELNNMVPQPNPLTKSVAVTGGGSEGRFRVYTVTDIPSYTAETFTFKIDGLVEQKMDLSWQEFLELKREVQVSDFHCVTGWSVYNNTWEGIKLKDLLDLAGVKPSASFVKFYSGDQVYTDSLTIEQARLDDVMVVVLHDGKPIPRELGGPVRLVIPKMYAYKSVKWLERIELIDHQHVGYWEERGYDMDAWLK